MRQRDDKRRTDGDLPTTWASIARKLRLGSMEERDGTASAILMLASERAQQIAQVEAFLQGPRP